jgi:LPPG:FO 2-phospho-L-lactate transferase
MPPEDITVIANTGDDIELYGLRICPDVDTVTYTLGGVINEATGWGVADDTFELLNWLKRYGEATWFNLGDRDLATHVFRTAQLNRGRSLTEVTDYIRCSLGVKSRILPMTDAYTPTRVMALGREMHLQEYFVRYKAAPRVERITYDDIDSARPAPGVEQALFESDTIVICPSNPFISIGPILTVPGVREALKGTSAKVIAITPIVGGRALKGPAADMLRDLGHEVSAAGVAGLYRDVVDLFVIDRVDASSCASIEALGMRVGVTNTVMNTLDDKQKLASTVLELASAL